MKLRICAVSALTVLLMCTFFSGQTMAANDKKKPAVVKKKPAVVKKKTAPAPARKPSQKTSATKKAAQAAAASELRSPIGADALSDQDSSSVERRTRNLPSRAYAVDGQTFFHQGRKFRVQGIAPDRVAVSSDLAKQRLQMLLDGGALSFDAIEIDESGIATAIVNVDGRNVAETMNNL